MRHTREDLERGGGECACSADVNMRGEVADPIWSVASNELTYALVLSLRGRRPVHESQTMVGLPNLTLDFLLRPATMTSRQHCVPGFG
jgi:hypothetical protein